MKSRENTIFLKNGKMVISVKIRNFSRSRMTKRTSLLESSREIYLQRRIPRQSEFARFSRKQRNEGHLAHFEWLAVCHMSSAELVNMSSSVGPTLTYGIS